MKELILEATEDTPEVILDPAKSVFSVKNVSLPEDAVEFYKPIFDWIKEYSLDANPESVFEFQIEYLNTASSKQIFELIILVSKVPNAYIKWLYEEIDEDMESLGQRFKNLVKCEFELISF